MRDSESGAIKTVGQGRRRLFRVLGTAPRGRGVRAPACEWRSDHRPVRPGLWTKSERGSVTRSSAVLARAFIKVGGSRTLSSTFSEHFVSELTRPALRTIS